MVSIELGDKKVLLEPYATLRRLKYSVLVRSSYRNCTYVISNATSMVVEILVLLVRLEASSSAGTHLHAGMSVRVCGLSLARLGNSKMPLQDDKKEQTAFLLTSPLHFQGYAYFYH